MLAFHCIALHYSCVVIYHNPSIEVIVRGELVGWLVGCFAPLFLIYRHLRGLGYRGDGPGPFLTN